MKAKAISPENTSRFMRYEKVLATLIKYGFEDIVSHPPFNKVLPQTNILVPSRNGKKVSQYTRYERIRLVCEELGTTFIKFAQIASNRPDLLPEPLIEELTKLQDNAPAIPLPVIRQMLDAELPRPVDELLEYFEEKPLASASIAQVHRARLHGGKEVILKIQRPEIRAEIAADIAILKNIVSIIDGYFPQYQVYNPAALVRMFEQSINEELSFKAEARNLRQFRNMFAQNPDVFIPDLYEELSTDRIICMEYVDGYKVTDLENLRAFKITGKDLALRGIRLYFEQVFEHSFFHADPHPGNIFVLEDGRIAFLDFGMMGTIIESDKVLFANILLAMYEQDVQNLKKAILKFSSGLDKEKQRELEYDIINVLRNYTNVSIENIDGNEVMKGLNALFFDYKIRIPPNLLLLLKALVIIEGVGLKLDPEYDIIANIGPYVKKLLAQKYDPQKLGKDVLRTIEEGTLLVKDLPEDIREIIRKVKEGKLHVEFEHKGLGPVLQNTDIFINRIAFTLITVAIIVSSSIIIVADVPPRVYNISVLGFIGLIIAAVLTFRLLYAISRHGRI